MRAYWETSRAHSAALKYPQKRGKVMAHPFVIPAYEPGSRKLLPGRLTVGHGPLKPSILVRAQARQLIFSSESRSENHAEISTISALTHRRNLIPG
jgi:hypothetical protein